MAMEKTTEIKENMEKTAQSKIGIRSWINRSLKDTVNAMTLKLGDSGYSEVHNTWHAEQCVTPFTRIYIVQEGSAYLTDGKQTFRMEADRAYIIPAGLVCSYHCDDMMRKLFFHVNVYRPDRYDLLWGVEKIGCLPLEKTAVDTLIHHYRSEGYLSAMILQASLMELLGRYLEQIRADTETICHSEDVTRTIDYIHRNLSARLRIDDLAAYQFVSRTYLTDKFRKETGISLGKYIDDQLMFEAQRRLYRTDASVGTISRELGFTDQFYFARRFKQLCGLSPLQYRKKSRQV